MPPQGSKRYPAEQDGIEILRQKVIDLKSAYTSHKIVLMGDSNAIDDSVDFMSNMNWYTPSCFCKPRKSQDRTLNKFGKTFLHLCKEFDIRVLHCTWKDELWSSRKLHL